MDIQRYGINNYDVSGKPEPRTIAQARVAGYDKSEITAMKQAGKIKCATCAARKYQDGSDENVSFKSASHISPEESAVKVAAHELEHVGNAYKKAAQNGGQVMQASVSLKTAVCPECGKCYVAGGLTRTRIKYNENNPYDNDRKIQQHHALAGRKINYAVGEN